MAEKVGKEAEKAMENVQAVNSAAKADKQKKSFIYIGPTTGTGLVKNTIFTGSREEVESYLKDTLEKIPQVRMLIVSTESLADCRKKLNMTGTLLNKYYNDVLSLSGKGQEVFR